MSATMILWGQIAVVFLIVLTTTWGATEWVAWRLGFQPQLGTPWFDLAGFPLYYPPAFFWWWYAYDAYAPLIFVEGAVIAASGGFLSVGVAIMMSVWRAREARRIAALYAIEKEARGTAPAERAALRQKQAAPLFDDLETWLQTQLPKLSGKTPLAQAIRYALNRLPKARPYLENGQVELDNNAVERAMRPVALGRKNWLFAGSEGGGTGAALVLPKCNTEAMNLHLSEIAAAVAPGAHAIVILDQAGWHFAKALDIPKNITLMALPPKCPELNPVENVWQFMRDNWLSNRVFTSYNDILDHCCFAWNQLTNQPWEIMSIGLRQWAHQ